MKQFFIGITEDDELYSIEIEPKGEGHDYFSMRGQTDSPIEYSNAVNRTREQLEDGELWKMAVEDDKTTMGLNDWVEHVINTDGEVSMIDNSCLPDEYTDENGELWLFESRSCGQHKVKTLKKYFISEKLFQDLMNMWDEYHLKEENPSNLDDMLRRLQSSPRKEEALKMAVDNVCE